MLVLTRKLHQSIQLLDRETGLEISVRVTDIGQGQVGLGIDAPQNVLIVRSEILGTPQAAKFHAAIRPADEPEGASGL